MEAKDLINAEQEVLHFDATPNDGYVLRILQAYLNNTNTRWATDMNGNCDNPLYQLMNKHQEERALLLNKAILKLSK